MFFVNFFNQQCGEKIEKAKEEQKELWNKRKLMRLKNNEEETIEEFLTNCKISKEDGMWLTDEEEADHFTLRYISEISLEVEKEERTKKWVEEHFF